MSNNYIYPNETNVLLGLAFQLHTELGSGFKEKVYHDAFEVLLKENNIPYEREKHIKMTYHNVELKHDFFYDFFCYDKIGIEIKALNELTGECEAQIINYIHVGKQKLGLLINFGNTSLEYKFYPNKQIL